MVKYFVVESSRVNGQFANALYERDTIDSARKELHNFMGYQINAEGVDYAMSAVMDASGNPIYHEVWFGEEA